MTGFDMNILFAAVAGAGIGAAAVWLIMRVRLIAQKSIFEAAVCERENALCELKSQAQTIAEMNATVARLETTIELEKKNAHEKISFIEKTEKDLSDAFKALSADALYKNNQSFLDLAKSTFEKLQSESKGDMDSRGKAVEALVNPIKESLEKVDSQVREIEKTREQAYGRLSEQVKSLISTQEKLHSETGNLVRALRTPTVRGRWGEIQLRRVVEMAGMLAHCDFVEQTSVETEEGKLRPDLVVNLPGGKNVVVDAKAPLLAYLDSQETPDEEKRSALLEDHSRQIRSHIRSLSSKSYWSQFDSTPEFVVMFLPGENFFSAALEHDPGLIEAGANESVILATPTTLIALLRAIAYGWQQEKIAESAQAIGNLGKDLYNRLRIFAEHFARAGKGLESAVEAFNKAIGSFEGRVLVAARKFNDLGGSSNDELPTQLPVEKIPRSLQAPEFDTSSDQQHKAVESPISKFTPSVKENGS